MRDSHIQAITDKLARACVGSAGSDGEEEEAEGAEEAASACCPLKSLELGDSESGHGSSLTQVR